MLYLPWRSIELIYTAENFPHMQWRQFTFLLTPLITSPLKFLRLQLLNCRQLFILHCWRFQEIWIQFRKFFLPNWRLPATTSLQFTYCLLVVLHTLHILNGPSISYRSLYMKQMIFNSITQFFSSFWLESLFERSSRAFMNFKAWVVYHKIGGSREQKLIALLLFSFVCLRHRAAGRTATFASSNLRSS